MNINAFINAIITAEHPEQPQSEPERKPVRLIDANSIKYTTMQIGHSHGGEPPETFAYKDDIDKLPTVEFVGRCKGCRYREQAEKDRIIESYKDIAEKYKSLLDEYSKKLKFAEAEKEALKSVVRRLSEMTGLTLVEPTQSDKYKEK